MSDQFFTMLGLFLTVFLVLSPPLLVIYGIYLAFSENLILGILALILHPLPFVLGVLALFGRKDAVHKLAVWLRLEK